MAGGDTWAALAQLADEARWHAFGRQGHQRGLAQQVQIGVAGRHHELGPVHALPFGVEERAFEMQAEKARLARHVARRRHGAHHHLTFVGNQRRQQAGGAKAAMSRNDGAHACGRRHIVQQHAAAAVHLDVDEARGQQGAGRQFMANRAVGHRAGFGHADNPAGPVQHGGRAAHRGAVEQAGRQHGVKG